MPAALGDPAVRPFYWSTERYLALVESGIIPESRAIELVAGQVIETMPQGELHLFLFRALQRAFASMGAFDAGLVVQPTVVLEQGNVYDPEFAFITPEAEKVRQLPRAKDVLFVVEVSVSSLSEDLGPKKSGYAVSQIPHYWVVDGVKRGVWTFSEPTGGVYGRDSFFSSDETIDVPVLGVPLPLATIFPVED